jgi:hypothetical protein
MKRIVFFANGQDEEVLITNKEWDKYLKFRDENPNDHFWCERIEIAIPTKFKVAGTPQDEVGHEILLEIDERGVPVNKWMKRDNRWFRIVRFFDGDPGTKTEYTGSTYLKNKLEKANLVPQEEYYEKKMYL